MGVINNLVGIFKMGSAPFAINSEYLDNSSVTSDLHKSERVQESKSIIEDPLSLVHSLGYKDKPYSLTYDTLKQMATKNSVVAAIIGTRINQVSSFSQPSRFTKDGVGYEITLRDPKLQPTKEQQKTILALEAFLENCGFSYDPHRDNFDAFLRKITRDSLTFDQLTFEVVPDRLGRPAEIYATDASTIRAAVIEPEEGEDYITHTDLTSKTNDIKWVQVYRGIVVAEFTGEELAFGIRNPRTDINIQPYGFSELEVLLHQITAHLWAEEYNSRYFSQGGTTKGILNLKGQNISKEQLDAFRRQWTAQIAGVTGAWKTPVVSVDGLEYINVSQSNREMEYEMWMNYLINIVSSVFQIDPAEINFPNRGGSGGGGGGGMSDSSVEDRIKNSKDKGLRPLLRFLESTINRYIIRRFSSEYSFNFVGLDKESETEKMALKDKEVRTIKTINEVRKEQGYEPLENGDIILDATYVNYVMQLKQEEAMAQQEQGMGGDGQEQAEEPTETPEVVWDGAGGGDNEEVQESQQQNAIDRSIDEVYPE